MNKKSNIFVNIARILSIAFDRSKEPHCVCPISKCPKITVFMDARESSARDCAAAVTEFFSKYKVSLKLFALDAEKGSAPKPIEGAQMLLYKDLKWFGRPKRSKSTLWWTETRTFSLTSARRIILRLTTVPYVPRLILR